tara:strand:- start:230 stop:955 length:726 start_codon:yes stop_codon:yes gene_type:complete
MKVFQKNQIITVACLCYFFVFPSNVAANQPKSLIGKVFFYKDIANFGGPFLKTEIFKNRIIAQSYRAGCSNLNRIILPFYIDESGPGVLTFNLYENSKDQKLVFSSMINSEDFPLPKKIGNYNVDGVLHYVWIPPVADSMNKHYTWELRADKFDEKMKIGLYMNHHSISQIQPVIIDGVLQKNIYATFYSYCQYRFEWRNIFKVTWKRLKREKLFLALYLILLSGIVVAIKLNKKSPVDLE